MSYQNGLGFDAISGALFIKILKFSSILLLVQIFQQKYDNHYFMFDKLSLFPRAAFYAFLTFTWLIWGIQSGESFIYFQF